MEADLMTSTNFYFLNQNFEVIHKLTQYESLMWVDKYDEPGNFEIYAPPLPEIKEAAQINNYFMSDKSEHLMIIEKLETTVSPDDGKRLVISGRSLESILDRRVLFMKCYFRDKNSPSTPSSSTTVGADNLEDAVRQLLEYLFISPTHWDNDTGTWVPATDRAVPNFVFQYSQDDVPLRDSLGRIIVDNNVQPIMVDNLGDVISNIVLKDCEFDKGENALNIVNKIVKQAGLGYKITLDENHNFVFRLIKGKDRTTGQFDNPAVIFSPKFNNLKSSKFTDDFGENFKNFVYTEGETYKSQRPTIVETGEATGLLRREVYVNSNVQHETESSNVTHEGIVKEKKKLTESEYQTALKEDAEKYYKKYASKQTLESEIEPRLTFQYGRDFVIGDILEVQDGTSNSGKVRCVEFIISHSESGYEEYPTFESVTDEEESPAQTSSSGGEYSDEGSKKDNTPYSHIGQIIQSTVLDTEEKVKDIYGLDTHWIQHTGYMLRGATSGVIPNQAANDGGADTVTLSENSMPSHRHILYRQQWFGADLVQSASTGTIYSWKGGAGTGGSTSYSYKAPRDRVYDIDNTGGGQAYNNVPKYKNVYIWERVS